MSKKALVLEHFCNFGYKAFVKYDEFFLLEHFCNFWKKALVKYAVYPTVLLALTRP